MKAVVVASNTVRVEDVPPPRVREPTDAVVRVARSAICGSDLHLLDGKTPGKRDGGVVGHEFVGEVVDAGRESRRHPPGTRVLGSFLIVCGNCGPCRARRFNHCDRRRALGLGTLTGDLDGAQAEFVRVPVADHNLKALTGDLANLEDEEALFCGDVLATGVYASSRAEPGPGELVVVIGAGPVGLFTAAAARRDGANVIVLDADPTRAAFARDRFGLEAVDASGGDAESVLVHASGGRLADVAIDAVGSIPAFKSALRCVRDGGRVVVVGVYGKERYDLPMGMVWVRGLELRFTGMANVQAHWDDALAAVRAGEIEPVSAITHRLPLERAGEGYELFRARAAMKVVLEP